jgi:hypothetical protein
MEYEYSKERHLEYMYITIHSCMSYTNLHYYVPILIMKMAVFWVVAPCSRPDDGGSKDL